MTELTLNLDFPHRWANNAGYFMAREHNFYREEGIDLSITAADPHGPDSLQRLSRGDVDVACNHPQRLMRHVELEDDVLSVAAVNDTGLESLIFDTRKPVHKMLDLEGNRVATPPSARIQHMLRTVMEQHGADPDRVEFLERRRGDQHPLQIQTGAFDAVWGGYWPWEGVLSQLECDRIDWYTAPELGAPDIHNSVLAVQGKTAREAPDLVRAFLRATGRGFRAAADAPHAAAATMSKLEPSYSDRAFAAAIAATATTWNLDTWGTHDMRLVRDYATWLVSEGFLYWFQRHETGFTDAFLPGAAGLKTAHAERGDDRGGATRDVV